MLLETNLQDSCVSTLLAADLDDNDALTSSIRGRISAAYEALPATIDELHQVGHFLLLEFLMLQDFDKYRQSLAGVLQQHSHCRPVDKRDIHNCMNETAVREMARTAQLKTEVCNAALIANSFLTRRYAVIDPFHSLLSNLLQPSTAQLSKESNSHSQRVLRVAHARTLP